MSALVSGYESSDDETVPIASSSSRQLPTLKTGPSLVEADDVDDAQLEEQARADAFGLSNQKEEVVNRSETKAVVKAAPDVLKEVGFITVKYLSQDPNGAGSEIIVRPTDKVMNVNLTYEEMSRPVAGPENPFDHRKNKGMNSLAGHVEQQAMDDYTFAMQRRTFDVHGYALNPSAENAGAKPIVGSLNLAHENGYMPIDAMRPSKAVKRETKRKRGAKGDLTVVDGDDAYMGPWAAWEQDKQDIVEEEEEETEEWREEKRRREEAKEAARLKMEEARQEKSIFHGESRHRTYIANARQGASRLCWSNVHAYTDRYRRQAQPGGGRDSTKRLRPRALCAYMGELKDKIFEVY